MKQMKLWVIAATLFTCGTVVSCTDKSQQTAAGDLEPAEVKTTADSIKGVIADYLIDSIGVFYDATDVCIPTIDILQVEDNGGADINVWGLYAVDNYNISGDTLKTVSGGSYPGLMHLTRTDGVIKLKSFERVEDGSSFLPSARRIYGQYFNQFQAFISDNARRDSVRLVVIREYVKANDMNVKSYQDYGWEPVTLE